MKRASSLTGRAQGRGPNAFVRFWSDNRWWLIGALGLMAYLLGYAGALKQFTAAGETRSVWDPFYRALQLFVMEDGGLVAGRPIPWQLEVARWLAPAVAAYTALSALAALFERQIQLLRLRVVKNHVVICGLGRKGLRLATDFRQHGERVVVIEADDQKADIHAWRHLGISVVGGSATDPSVLARARVWRANRLIAACGDDGTNVEAALAAYQLISARRDSGRRVDCFVHIKDLKLRNLLEQSAVGARRDDAFELRFFNIFENTARALLEQYPPDCYVDTARGNAIHVIVIGFGRTGESVALQAARIGHYANDRKLRLTVIDRSAPSRAEVFLLRYPQFEQVCEIRFLEMDVDGAAFLGCDFLELAGGNSDIAAVYVCLDTDERGLSCALTLLGRIKGCDAPIVVRMAQEAGLAWLLHSEAQVRAFAMMDESCRRELLLLETQDRLARAIHDAYRSGAAARRGAGTVDWESLAEGLKESCRQQADHIPVKLRAIGCRTRLVSGGQASFRFSPEEVELLARMEHSRWNAERTLAGWRYSEGPGNTEQRTSPYLVEWSRLPEDVREMNRETVRQIPTILAAAGLEIYRAL